LADLLCNQNIPVKIISGVPGSGKTKFAISYGLEFLRKGLYKSIFVVRHNVGIGKENGFLKGTKEEKILGWFGFLEDNLSDYQYTLEEMIERGMLEIEAVEYLKGRDIKNSFIIIDECEDLTEAQFKVIGERVSSGSVICFVGDYNQTTQEMFKKNSGLLRAIQNITGYVEVGMVNFDSYEDNMRGAVSKLFSHIY
jgi:PhoH-like ATPase